MVSYPGILDLKWDGSGVSRSVSQRTSAGRTPSCPQQLVYCYGLTCALFPQPNSYIEALIPKVTVFVDGAFMGVAKIKCGHKSVVLIHRTEVLIR